MRDFKRLVTDPPAGICATPEEDDILSWHGVIFGPEDTPWEGGTFKVTLQFSEEYPNKAPVVKFVSRMFHPNSLFFSFSSSFAPLFIMAHQNPSQLSMQSTRTGASAWTSCRTCGARSTTSRASSQASSRCCRTPTPRALPTARPRGSTQKTSASTRAASARWSSSRGRTTSDAATLLPPTLPTPCVCSHFLLRSAFLRCTVHQHPFAMNAINKPREIERERKVDGGKE